ncbi:hypothetical protein EFO75_01725 [Limosilactobacillus reuteri]|uniref:hypothetical protein n=1 Tax=Limosilactobacillus TaxID=2742598 RepID=UPI0021A5D49D|nr:MULTISPECIES: hypothetical protein [Limosilactobacillus]MCT3207450.1 hypothetical protein [Limosilactobacillus reuteri]MCT3217326.1 hypothetical protein [Limosilactobacillus reuteri]MDE7040537.1 hypothetical protein [Limosilactobacillus sp.]
MSNQELKHDPIISSMFITDSNQRIPIMAYEVNTELNVDVHIQFSNFQIDYTHKILFEIFDENHNKLESFNQTLAIMSNGAISHDISLASIEGVFSLNMSKDELQSTNRITVKATIDENTNIFSSTILQLSYVE